MEARQQLKEWRRTEDLTQSEAATLLGVTRNFIGFLERGDRTPGLTTANTIKRVAGIPTEAWDDPAPVDGAAD